MPLSVILRGDIWYVRGTFQGISVYQSTQTRDENTAEAVRALKEKEILASLLDPEAAKQQRNRAPFDFGADDYLKNGRKKGRSARSVAFITRLKRHFGTTPLHVIDQEAADAAVAAIVGDDAKPSTKRRAVIGPLVAILRHNAKRNRCPRPEFEVPEVGESQTPFLTPREALALIDSAADHLKPLLVFLFGTGARLSEALGLDWNDVDITKRFARLGVSSGGTKNGKIRNSALPPAVIVALANLGHREGAVFRRDDGEPYASTDGEHGGQIKTGWKGACRRAGLTVEANNPDGTPALSADGTRILVARFSPHACRHSWATWFHALSLNLLLLKDEGGWKSTSMVTRYAKLMNSEHEPDIAKVWGGPHPRITTVRAPGVQRAKASKK